MVGHRCCNYYLLSVRVIIIIYPSPKTREGDIFNLLIITSGISIRFQCPFWILGFWQCFFSFWRIPWGSCFDSKKTESRMGGEKNLMFFGVYTPISFWITHNPRGLLGKLHLKKGRLRGGFRKKLLRPFPMIMHITVTNWPRSRARTTYSTDKVSVEAELILSNQPWIRIKSLALAVPSSTVVKL